MLLNICTPRADFSCFHNPYFLWWFCEFSHSLSLYSETFSSYSYSFYNYWFRSYLCPLICYCFYIPPNPLKTITNFQTWTTTTLKFQGRYSLSLKICYCLEASPRFYRLFMKEKLYCDLHKTHICVCNFTVHQYQ